jgi:phosphomannomutase/phosphoglucomutase
MVKRKKLFGTNGIRGLSNKDLTPEKVIKIGSAIGTFFNTGKLIVGCDARTTGPIFTKGIIAGLNSTGCDVFFIGMSPTPSTQYAIKTNQVDGGVIITASHNPPEYNGIKVIWKDGVEISREQEKQIEKIFFSEKISYANWNRIGTTQKLYRINEKYIDGVCQHLNSKKIQSKKFKIVVDAGNSVTALTTPKF